MKPHIHADLIKLWADGAQVQIRAYDDTEWFDIDEPTWDENESYRIKPDEPKPPVVRWMWAYEANGEWYTGTNFLTEDEAKRLDEPNVKLEWSRTEFLE